MTRPVPARPGDALLRWALVLCLGLPGCPARDPDDPLGIGDPLGPTVDPTLATRDEITGLQEGPTGPGREQQLAALLTGLSGRELLLLKYALDERGDHRSLHRLLYRDIDDAAVRQQILAHFAEAVGEHEGMRLLSDIDDTLYANWVDARYPAGVRYPGVLAFYREMAAHSGLEWEDGRHVVFLSARPGDRAGLVEGLTLETLQARGLARSTLLAGGFSSLHSDEAIADRKVSNFVDYAPVYPEFSFTFIGDSGQGDEAVARRLRAEHGALVKAAFIHDVVNRERGQDPLPSAERAAAAADRIFYFDSYAHAAVLAHQLGLLEREQAERVVQEAATELAAIEFADEQQRTQAQADQVEAEALLAGL